MLLLFIQVQSRVFKWTRETLSTPDFSAHLTESILSVRTFAFQCSATPWVKMMKLYLWKSYFIQREVITRRYVLKAFATESFPQIRSFFIGPRSSKDYYKRPGGVVGVYGKCDSGEFLPRVDVCCRNGLWEEVSKTGTWRNRDCQWASRIVLTDFTEDALIISAGSLFQNGAALVVKANRRRRVQHRCWWNL